ncbi:uncharacterized protein LOC144903560 [Branchiostoma floridae x Branchiostoma belcheri]
MASASPSLGTPNLEELTCSICLELFTRPKVLPCIHTFCQDCLSHHAAGAETFQCPICRLVVGCPQGVAADLPDNNKLGRKCEILKQRSLITEGRNILESYVVSLWEEEKKLNEQKQQTDNGIKQAYDQMVQKLAVRKGQLLSESEQKHRENLKRIQNERDRVLTDTNGLSATCDRAEQELEQERVSENTFLAVVVERYRKLVASPVPTQPAVFQPTDTPVPALGHMTVQSISSAANKVGGTLDGKGTETCQFKDPSGVTVSDQGEIFVADYRNQRLKVFTLQGTLVNSFLLFGSGGQNMYPHDVAMDREGNLWVVGNTETGELAVRYTKQGRVLRKLDLQRSCWYRGVAVDTRRNHILITQTKEGLFNKHGEVQVFTPEGRLVRTVGRQQGMKHPWYITVDRNRRMLVSDWGNDCVFVYNKDGQFLFQFGTWQSGEGKLYYPYGICTDKTGNIIVANSKSSPLKLFDKTGRFLRHVATDIRAPLAVAMGPQGQLVVADWATGTVAIFHSYQQQQQCGTVISHDGRAPSTYHH